MTVSVAHVDRDHVMVTGPEALAYLHSQVSQRLDDLAVGESRWSFVLQPQGKSSGVSGSAFSRFSPVRPSSAANNHQVDSGTSSTHQPPAKAVNHRIGINMNETQKGRADCQRDRVSVEIMVRLRNSAVRIILPDPFSQMQNCRATDHAPCASQSAGPRGGNRGGE